jgi:hypothetical protein
MEVRWAMIVVQHVDHDPKESRDFGHVRGSPNLWANAQVNPRCAARVTVDFTPNPTAAHVGLNRLLGTQFDVISIQDVHRSELSHVIRENDLRALGRCFDRSEHPTGHARQPTRIARPSKAGMRDYQSPHPGV